MTNLWELLNTIIEYVLLDTNYYDDNYSSSIFSVTIKIEAKLDLDELYQLKDLGIMTQQDIETATKKTKWISTDLGIVFTKSEKYKWPKSKTIEELTKVLQKYNFSQNYINFVLSQLDSYILEKNDEEEII